MRALNVRGDRDVWHFRFALASTVMCVCLDFTLVSPVSVSTTRYLVTRRRGYVAAHKADVPSARRS